MLAGWIASRQATWLHVTFLLAVFAIAWKFIWAVHANFMSGLVLEFLTCVMTLKLWSYAHVMSAER